MLLRRASHVVAENARVLDAVAALDARDVASVGRLLSASHASLRDLYEVSSPELDALVEIAGAVPGVLGARLTGAGFGGCTITLVRRAAVGRLTEAILEAYPARTGLTPRVFEVRPSRGAPPGAFVWNLGLPSADGPRPLPDPDRPPVGLGSSASSRRRRQRPTASSATTC